MLARQPGRRVKAGREMAVGAVMRVAGALRQDKQRQI